MKLLISLLLLSTSALAGPYDQPYSIIETDTLRSADSNIRPVIVNRVDGETVTDRRAVVPPGPHKVTVDLPPRQGFHVATQNTFDLVTKPCYRYYVVAKLVSPALQEWTPVVKQEEPMGDCMKKFKVSIGK